MQKFKSGDRVREIDTGDEGIVDRYEFSNSFVEERVYVRWTTGEDRGMILHIKENNLELMRQEISSVEEAIRVLTAAGYIVQLAKAKS